MCMVDVESIGHGLWWCSMLYALIYDGTRKVKLFKGSTKLKRKEEIKWEKVGIDLERTQPNDRARLRPPHAPWSGAPNPSLVSGPLSPSAIINRGGAGALGMRFTVPPEPHPQNPRPICKGVLERRVVSLPPPLTLVYWHRCHRPRLWHHARNVTAPLVATLERICITEPVMAGSSSLANSEGSLPILFVLSISMFLQ